MEFVLVDWLRILCGIWFVPHLIGKSLHFEKAGATFEAAGFRPGTLFVGLTVVAEGLAAVGLIFSIYPGVAAILGALVLAGAGYAVLRINGMNWRWQKMGPEYPIFWAFVCLLTAFA
ncbi:MAG: DoxX family membrane protein [Rhizobium sp.]